MPCDVCIVWERCGRVSRGSVLSVHVLYMFAYLFVFSPGWESADVILTGKEIITDSVGLEAHLGVREEGREQQTGKTCKWGLQKVSYHDKQWSLKLALGSFWEQRQEESFSHLNNSCPKPDVVLGICTVWYSVWRNVCVCRCVWTQRRAPTCWSAGQSISAPHRSTSSPKPSWCCFPWAASTKWERCCTGNKRTWWPIETFKSHFI